MPMLMSSEPLVCDKCPHLGGRPPRDVLGELNHIKLENEQLRSVFETATEAFKERDEEIKQLKEENNTLRMKLQEEHQKPFVIDKKTEKKDNNESKEKSSRPRGAPKGHRGGTRKKPEKVDEYIDVYPESCTCGCDDLSDCKKVDEHTVEEIEIKKVKVVCYRRHYRYCKKCGKTISARLSQDIAKGYVGPVARAVAGYLRYGVKIPFEKVSGVFRNLFGMELTPQALVGIDKKTAETAKPLYEILEEKARWSKSINADETGWKVAANNAWLWCFVNDKTALYRIDRSRGAAVVEAVLGKKYSGILGSDCYPGYNPLEAKGKQKCLVHYERDAKDIEKFYPYDDEALAFVSLLKDIFKRARAVKRDWEEGEISAATVRKKALEFEAELDELTLTPFRNKEAEKLRTRLLRHKDENFTFLRYHDVDSDNNRAERALRPSVVMRKNTYGNNSQTGAENHQVIMSVIETAKMNGTEPLKLLTDIASGKSVDELKRLLLEAGTVPEQRCPG